MGSFFANAVRLLGDRAFFLPWSVVTAALWGIGFGRSEGYGPLGMLVLAVLFLAVAWALRPAMLAFARSRIDR